MLSSENQEFMRERIINVVRTCAKTDTQKGPESITVIFKGNCIEITLIDFLSKTEKTILKISDTIKARVLESRIELFNHRKEYYEQLLSEACGMPVVIKSRFLDSDGKFVRYKITEQNETE